MKYLYLLRLTNNNFSNNSCIKDLCIFKIKILLIIPSKYYCVTKTPNKIILAAVACIIVA